VSSNSKKIAKLKKKYSKWPIDRDRAGFNTKVLTILPRNLTILLLKRFLVKSEYRLKRESTKYFHLSNRAYGRGELKKCDRLLTIAIELVGSNFPYSYNILLRDAASTTFKNSNIRGLMSDSVLIATKQISPAIFDATSWYQLSRGLFSLGYFRAAWVARENSLDLSIVEGSTTSSSPTAVSRAIEAHLERLNFDPVKRALTEKIGLSSKDLESFREAVNLLDGTSIKNQFDERVSDGDPEVLFRKLVTGKKVALVGAGPPRGEYGEDIDSADTVARPKFVGVENLPSQKFHGARCNIAYEAAIDVLAEYVDLGLNIDFFDDIDLLVSTSDLKSFCSKPVANLSTTIPMYRTTAISGIILLYQLIGAFPKSLVVYGFDFRASRKQYSDPARDFLNDHGPLLGHPYPGFDSEDIPAWLVASDFTWHDFVSNFCFAQNLYRAGLFDIEPYGKSILELTPYQYVERLEEMLGDW